jgi:hypothetical protein
MVINNDIQLSRSENISINLFYTQSYINKWLIKCLAHPLDLMKNQRELMEIRLNSVKIGKGVSSDLLIDLEASADEEPGEEVVMVENSEAQEQAREKESSMRGPSN